MTIKEIAEMAGVSQSTVSLTLNNRPGVGEETRRLILDIANKNGYSKKSNTPKQNILFIRYIGSGAAIEQNGDFIARVIDAIENTTSILDYNLVIKNVVASDFENELREIDFTDFAGVIFLATETTYQHAALLEDIKVPLMAVDNMLEDFEVNAIVMDNYGGIYSVVRHLYALGHRKIGYIDSKTYFSNFEQRALGYKTALKKLKLDFCQEHVKRVLPTLEGAYHDMLAYLDEMKELPTAYVAANDTIAIGAIKALKERGINVPEQISITGYDDIPFCMMLDKSLTTMKVNKDRLGEVAVKMLDEQIKNPSDDCIKIVLKPKLITRESTRYPY